MKKYFILLLILISACGKSYVKKGETPEKSLETGITHIDKDLVLKGNVSIRGVLRVEKGVKLSILPGTKVEFTKLDRNNDGIGDAGLIIYGDIIAEGTKDEPIIFTSDAIVKNMNDWQSIYLEGSQSSIFKNCILEYGYKALHIHSSPTIVTRCELRYNQGGIHTRASHLMLDHNYIHHNNIGLRIWDCDPIITLNIIRENQTGIFCAEGIKKAFIQDNNIYQNNEYNIALGESQSEMINAQNNYWGSINIKEIEKKIYDKQDVEYIGKVIYSPYFFNLIDIDRKDYDR